MHRYQSFYRNNWVISSFLTEYDGQLQYFHGKGNLIREVVCSFRHCGSFRLDLEFFLLFTLVTTYWLHYLPCRLRFHALASPERLFLHKHRHVRIRISLNSFSNHQQVSKYTNFFKCFYCDTNQPKFMFYLWTILLVGVNKESFTYKNSWQII